MLEEAAVNQSQQYPEAFRQHALEKVYSRGSGTVKGVAEALNMNARTLKNCMKSHPTQSTTKPGASSKRLDDWSLAERLEVLRASHGLDEQGLNGLCREKAIFGHHLQHWRAAIEGDPLGSSPLNASALSELKATTNALEHELKRKAKVLEEAAALGVLEKSTGRTGRRQDG